jgi:hypothetical protein
MQRAQRCGGSKADELTIAERVLHRPFSPTGTSTGDLAHGGANAIVK